MNAAPRTGAPGAEAPAPGAASRRAALAGAAVVVALGLAAYSNSFSVPFQFDDGKEIVENPSVRDLAGVGGLRLTRSVAYLTFALNGALGDGSTWGYHAVNLAIHLAAALVLYALAALICRALAPPGSALHRAAPLAALAAAALFVAHPLQTQAVTYVVQRIASLAALLYLTAVWAYARAGLEDRPARRGALYAGALAAAALGLFTRENVATLPAALAIVDLCALPGPARRRIARLAPFAVLAVAAVLVTAPRATVQASSAEFAIAAQAKEAPAWVVYALSQPSVILAYLRLLLLPVGQSVDHDPAVHASLSAPVLLSSALLAALLAVPAAAGWRARRSAGGRVALLAVGWFVATMAVESSVLPLADAMVEHRMYLPSAGIFLAAGIAFAWAVDRAAPRGRTLALAAAGACVLLLAGATFARNRVWRDPLTLWSDALAKAPGRSRPHIYVGQAYLERGMPERAVPLFQAATRLPPRTPIAEMNLGAAYKALGRPADAEAAMREGLAIGARRLPGAHLMLANLLRDGGRYGEACDAYQAELGADPASREARSNLVVCALQRGDPAGAAALAERLDHERPGDPRVLFNLALASAALGDAPRAAGAYRRFLAVAGPALEPQRRAAREWLAEHGGAAP
ncbi:MAG TPA: tetratricopeptide repeat protein [Anaeromyxobacter sp.]|nr:tetratricopeptide repeat protein [Anaeromyxobacter sp.]